MSTAQRSRGRFSLPALRAIASLAWREGRSARRGLLLSMAAIALGVAALVSIDSFAANVTRSITDQSRTLMGGDVEITSRSVFSKPMEQWLDSLQRAGIPNVRAVTFPSMAVVPHTGRTRFSQIRGVTPGYPFYGDVTTEPADQYVRIHDGPFVVVDPSFLTATESRVGDTIALGTGTFTIIGTLKDVPGTTGIFSALGPRIYISEKYLPGTGLLAFGSTAEHIALLKTSAGADLDALIKPHRTFLDAENVRARTVSQRERRTADSVDRLSGFIGIVGLIALLLGGIGVASGVRAFVARKIDTVAILRCLGASSGQVLAMYVTQSAVMGLASATLGAVLGVLLQFGLPYAFGQFLPVDVSVSIEPAAIATGIAIGGWIALIFSLYPLLALRNVSPIQTLRRQSDADVLAMQRSDRLRWIVSLALVASVAIIAISRAETTVQGLWISLATGAVLLTLVASAALLGVVAKRLLRQRWPYVVRQGVANIYRPGNQTRAVVLSLGFGAFLLTTLYLVQNSLLTALDVRSDTASANMLFFDVQADQAPTLDSLLAARGYRVTQRDPVVSMRIAEINGEAVRQISADTVQQNRARWALRREYRSTFRDSLLGGERLVAGRWFSQQASDTSEVSLEADLASDLDVQLNDVITWDVQGVRIPTRLTSLRTVQWTRFEPNFFAVFAPQALQQAPRQYIMLAAVPGDSNVTALQRDLASALPNVSSIDLSLIAATLTSMLDKVTSAIRFMGLFSLAIGIPVLFSAVAATRRDRIRESVLLKTLGASRRQVASILLTEYTLLGILGSGTGLLLSYIANWALLRWVLQEPVAVTFWIPVLIALVMTAVTVLIGGLASRQVFRETAMAALRE